MVRQSSPQVAGYYTVIKGKKYDRRMIELADGLTKGRGDGRISVADAKTLLRVVKDSNSYSPTEKQTMDYIRKRYKFTKEGDEYFRAEIRKWAAGKGKKKSGAKEKKSTSREVNVVPLTTAPSTIQSEAPVATGKKSSPWKEILIGLILLVVISAAFYFFAFRSSCGKALLEHSPKPAPGQTEAPKPVAAEAEKPPVVAKVVAKSEVSPELKSLIEKTQLIFVAEKSELTPATVKKLDELAGKLKGENVKLQLTGHTCSLGPKSLNQEISEKRARVVKDALIARGVTAENIETRGVADSEPAGDNKTVAGRVASRRVTFKVLQ